MNRAIVFFAALLAVWATEVMAQQYCGEGSVAHAVQVRFDGCDDDMPVNVTVFEGDRNGLPLLLTKKPSGYWEADMDNFEPAKLTLCSPKCGRRVGCARFREMVTIDSGLHHGVCAARYKINCTEEVWTLRVDTEPGPWFVGFVVYKRPKRTSGVKEAEQRGENRTSFDLCGLTKDEQVELELHGTYVIPLKTIDLRSFEQGRTIKVIRDDLASRLALSPEDRKHLPAVVTFTIIDR